MLRKAIVLVLIFVIGCKALDKDNKPKEPNEIKVEVKSKLDVYRPLVTAQLDEHGLVTMGGSVGDSALFSCLARSAGAASFDPAILFVNGKPIRHPNIAPGISRTPVSKDMVSGILWCLYDLHKKGNTDHAKELVRAMIDFGKAHKLTIGTELGWMFCTDEDRVAYSIKDEDWFGRCFMPPATIKDIYRVAKLVGVECDQTCQEYTILGPNIPADKIGFERHLAVTGTVRNGLVEGAINDNSLKIVLKNAAEAQPRNALYLAAYHTFLDGYQADSYAALMDESLFPADRLPTSANYCSDYLFQRDEDQKDWVPCGDGSKGPDGRGVDFIFAAALALGELY